MYSIILPHLKQRRKISFDISPLLYALHQPIISMDMDHGSQLLESDRNSHPKTSRINQSESDRNSQS